MSTLDFLSAAEDWLDDFFRNESPDGEEAVELLALLSSATEAEEL
jgi:hypothetical protein